MVTEQSVGRRRVEEERGEAGGSKLIVLETDRGGPLPTSTDDSAHERNVRAKGVPARVNPTTQTYNPESYK